MSQPPMEYIPSYHRLNPDERSAFWTDVLFFGGLGLIMISTLAGLARWIR